MNILQKIMATIKAESRELTDAVMDSGGTGKLEQAFDDSRYKLKEAKSALTQMMSKERQSLQILGIINDKISQQELLIEEALSQEDDSEIIKMANEVVDLEHSKDLQNESIKEITSNVIYLQRQLEQSERELKEFARQLSMLKTTQNIQKATDIIMKNIDGADKNLLSAKKSLDRIRAKHKSKNLTDPIIKEKNDKKNLTTQSTVLLENQALNQEAMDVIKRIQKKK